jgi:hypothetical protein
MTHTNLIWLALIGSLVAVIIFRPQFLSAVLTAMDATEYSRPVTHGMSRQKLTYYYNVCKLGINSETIS